MIHTIEDKNILIKENSDFQISGEINKENKISDHSKLNEMKQDICISQETKVDEENLGHNNSQEKKTRRCKNKWN